MTPQEFTKSMTVLGLAYNKEFTQEQVEVWYRFFKDTDDKDFRKALSRIIETSKFIPSIAEIKQEIAALKTPVLQLSPEEEWTKVERMIGKYGYYNAEEAEKEMDPFTARVVKRMGGFRSICQSTEGEWQRKNFVKLFNEMSDTATKVTIYSEPQMTIAEIKEHALLQNPFHNMIEHNYDFDELENKTQIIKKD